MTSKRVETKPRRMWALVVPATGRIVEVAECRRILRELQIIHYQSDIASHRVEPVRVKPERRKGRKG